VKASAKANANAETNVFMEITPLGFLGTGKEPPAYGHGSLVAGHVKEKTRPREVTGSAG
jgi:hypothetical protein